MTAQNVFPPSPPPNPGQGWVMSHGDASRAGYGYLCNREHSDVRQINVSSRIQFKVPNKI